MQPRRKKEKEMNKRKQEKREKRGQRPPPAAARMLPMLVRACSASADTPPPTWWWSSSSWTWCSTPPPAWSSTSSWTWWWWWWQWLWWCLIFLPFPRLCSAQAGQRCRGSCQPSHPRKHSGEKSTIIPVCCAPVLAEFILHCSLLCGNWEYIIGSYIIFSCSMLLQNCAKLTSVGFASSLCLKHVWKEVKEQPNLHKLAFMDWLIFIRLMFATICY